MEQERRHWRIYGGVQGVGFRWFATQAAGRLRGYARNLPDGSVQVEAAGDPTELRHLFHRLQAGPPHATVTTIEQLPPTAETLPHPFTIRH